MSRFSRHAAQCLVLMLAASDLSHAAEIPQAVAIEYATANGGRGHYLVQAPTNPTPDARIVIYMHGARKDETQGMNLFPILRQQLADKGWILVSPRDYEYDGLTEDLAARFGKRRLYLAGASAGARVSFDELCRRPATYSGVFLIGPALRQQKPIPGQVVVPTFIIYGDQDGPNTDSAALVASELKKQRVPVKEIVIEGDGHEAPYGRQAWWYDALTFVTRETFAPPATNKTTQAGTTK